ncbi:hypothetical protein A15D_00130 [Alcanivorax sp. MD8A]|uniref:DUF3325 domain-containing protein n=1 Tax=Alcanivorax sp. MD8A TaxID=1177157 RepID=UPI000C9AF224|nr:DUF3325 domain-containing protein [Alcanivorax sp. MD8A]PNE04351.1 hypothetical protein A15D_00130 [Alcanivorax sp. MD8A]
MTLLNLALLLCAFAGFVALALAMPKHSKHLLRRNLSPTAARLARLLGWGLLAVALSLAIVQWRFSIGSVTWFGWLSLAGVALVFALPRWPWQPVKPQRPARKNAAGKTRIPVAADPVPAGPAKIAVALTVIALPLTVFAWQLAGTGQKPLLRDDALSGEIGPWTFVIAEKEQAAPDILALDVPLKQFMIRFCERCQGEIRQAFLKVREPRSTTAAGNAFFGRGEEKTVQIPIPVAATLADSLWLTVEGNDGTFHHQPLAIERLSPSLATFIKERP